MELFISKGLLRVEEKNLEGDFATIYKSGYLSENHRGKISWPRVYIAGAVSHSHLLLSFPDVMDEFTPGVAEMAAGRAGIIVQAKALWLYLGRKRWGSCGRWPCWQGPAVYLKDRAGLRNCSSLHAPLQGSGSQQCPLLGVLWGVFLHLAGMTWVLEEMHVSNLFFPEDNYNWRSRAEGSSFFSPLICWSREMLRRDCLGAG